MVQHRVWLIAVSQAQLLKDGMRNFAEAKLEDLCMNFLEKHVGINIDLTKIKIHL